MSQLCLWLRHGQVEMFGPTSEVVTRYEQEVGEAPEDALRTPELAEMA
jgi:ABC-type polysaccharide/polyol phosphate transport system ATPase subunit